MSQPEPVGPSEKAKQELAVLQRVAARVLERKRRLGQYAVVWKDGKPALIGGEEEPSRPAGEQE